MASDVDICNLAMSHFGQDATISAIDPPDGSAEAEHCARFFPMARDQVLEDCAWTFATFRTTLATLTNDRDDWEYRYTLPANCIKPRILLPEGYTDSEIEGEPFERENDSIYSNAANATLIYTKRITDPTKFSPLFTMSLSWLLASYTAGPITKDASGGIQARLYKRYEILLGQAKASNANTTKARATYVPTAKRVR